MRSCVEALHRLQTVWRERIMHVRVCVSVRLTASCVPGAERLHAVWRAGL